MNVADVSRQLNIYCSMRCTSFRCQFNALRFVQKWTTRVQGVLVLLMCDRSNHSLQYFTIDGTLDYWCYLKPVGQVSQATTWHSASASIDWHAAHNSRIRCSLQLFGNFEQFRQN